MDLKRTASRLTACLLLAGTLAIVAALISGLRVTQPRAA